MAQRRAWGDGGSYRDHGFPHARRSSADRAGMQVPSPRRPGDNGVPRPAAPLDDTDGVVHVLRFRRFRWQAWSPGLVNPRYGLTKEQARRRALADLEHEWRTGHVAAHQRQIRETVER